MLLESRDTELKKIIRYKQNPVCKPMYYTPDLWIHVSRVTWLSEISCKHLGLDKNLTKKIIRHAMFHDDTEIIAGDIATPEKQSWSKEKLKAYEQECKNAIPTLVDTYGKDLGVDYQDILTKEENKNSLSNNEDISIHSIIEYTDKLDALMETLHELYSGNPSFLSSMKSHFKKNMTCWEYILGRVERRRNQVEKILQRDIPQAGIFNISQIQNLDIQHIVKNGNNHSQESVQLKSGIEIYDIWKDLHFTYGSKEHRDYLYTERVS